MDFKAMKLEIKDKMEKHKSLESKRKSKRKLYDISKYSITRDRTADSGRTETAII